MVDQLYEDSPKMARKIKGAKNMVENMNVVLIVSDTFRWDHLGCYGNRDIKTPCLDRFAKRSVVFDRCYACSFPTMPARADIFTGRWTYTYMGWESLTESLAPKKTTLPECLQLAHYHTKAVVDTPFFVRNRMGYDRGFVDFEWVRGQGLPWYYQSRELRDIYLQRRSETDYCAPATMLAASRWLEHHYKEKFFLYVDTWDPHEPWDPPQWYVEPYYPGYDGRIVMPCYGFWKEQGMSEEDLKMAHASYCGEVTMVDRWIGFLLDGIEAMGLMDNTAIIFTTDHGFYFGEHGILGKMVGITKENRIVEWSRSPLYEEVAHIPLLAYVPGVKARRVDALVSLPDVMPTILELTGVDIPSTVQARSLVPLLERKEKKLWNFVVTSHPIKRRGGEITRVVDDRERRLQATLPSTITSKEWALIYSIEGEPAELYHLSSDPRQEKNLIDEKTDVAQDLLDKFVSRLEKAGTNPELINLRRRL